MSYSWILYIRKIYQTFEHEMKIHNEDSKVCSKKSKKIFEEPPNPQLEQVDGFKYHKNVVHAQYLTNFEFEIFLYGFRKRISS